MMKKKATKTITLELDAYEKLRRHRRGSESFSSVIRRARWDASATANDLLRELRVLLRLHPESFLDDDALDKIDARERS